MISVEVPYMPNLNGVEIEIAALYVKQVSSKNNICNANWPALFPYSPKVDFFIARSDESFFIHFEVDESNIRANYSKDHEPVWEDSCVEFFCKLPHEEYYYNFEFNCIGACVATKRKGREQDIQTLAEPKMQSIKRFPTLGNHTFEEKVGHFHWELTVEIPFHVMGIQNNKFPEVLRANFYKCGDGTSVPHYLSWSKIETEKPNFHCPEFFGYLNMLN